jgi:putative transposase
MPDQLAKGRSRRILNASDDFTQKCVPQMADFSTLAPPMASEFPPLTHRPPSSGALAADKGPALTCKSLFFQFRERGIEMRLIQHGKNSHHESIESFNNRFRVYCPNLHRRARLEEGGSAFAGGRRTHCNDPRPHRSLGRKPPAAFARQVA